MAAVSKEYVAVLVKGPHTYFRSVPSSSALRGYDDEQSFMREEQRLSAFSSANSFDSSNTWNGGKMSYSSAVSSL